MESLFSKSYTHLVMLLDRSGSMSSILEATITGFNNVILEQRKIQGQATVSLYQFDDRFETSYEMKNLTDDVELNTTNFIPRGQTRLLDGIGRAIAMTQEAIAKLEEKPTRIIFTILTDGGENDSQEFTQDVINTQIKSMEDNHGWVFVYVGANQDAVATAKGLGIKAGSALTYGANTRGMTNASFSMNKLYSRVRNASDEEISLQGMELFSSFDSEDHDLQDE